jgi:hypothetical protein
MNLEEGTILVDEDGAREVEVVAGGDAAGPRDAVRLRPRLDLEAYEAPLGSLAVQDREARELHVDRPEAVRRVLRVTDGDS